MRRQNKSASRQGEGGTECGCRTRFVVRLNFSGITRSAGEKLPKAQDIPPDDWNLAIPCQAPRPVRRSCLQATIA